MARPAIDITGQWFGRLLAVEPLDRREGGSVVWLFRCNCGSEVERQARAVARLGGLRSCGCLRRSHGESGTRLYGIWKAMRQRCRDADFPQFDDYGGRGITVCETWDAGFEPFREWALANGYDDALTIDRRDNDGNYEPDNCRWVTMLEQAKNRRPFQRA